MRRLWSLTRPWLFVTVTVCMVYSCGYRSGRDAGFKAGAAEMKAAIFGAIERITAEPPTPTHRSGGE